MMHLKPNALTQQFFLSPRRGENSYCISLFAKRSQGLGIVSLAGMTAN